VRITRGGKSITPDPSTHWPEIDQERIEPLTHSLWESMIDMQHERAQACAYWQRVEKLNATLLKRPDHPKASEIGSRIDYLSALVREHQWRFLMLEDDANIRWKRMPPPVREEQQLPAMFGVDASEDGILGAWHRPLGAQKAPPCPIVPIMFKFLTVSHAAAYKGRASWLNTAEEQVPEAALRRRKG
jgi:hypothetical protein